MLLLSPVFVNNASVDEGGGDYDVEGFAMHSYILYVLMWYVYNAFHAYVAYVSASNGITFDS